VIKIVHSDIKTGCSIPVLESRIGICLYLYNYSKNLRTYGRVTHLWMIALISVLLTTLFKLGLNPKEVKTTTWQHQIQHQINSSKRSLLIQVKNEK